MLAALSLAVDLGLGLPMEHMLRATLLATGLARRLGLDERAQATVYYATQVTWIGCHADSREVADWFGDDIAFRRDTYDVDWSGLPFLRLLVSRAGRGHPPVTRAARAAAMLVAPRARLRDLIQSHCASASALARRAGLGDAVSEALRFAFERWDGGGLPGGAAREQVPIEMRVVHLAETAEVYLHRSGVADALAMVRARSGTQFDPAVVAAFAAGAAELAEEAAAEDVWRAALDRAPERGAAGELTEDELDELLEAVGDFADLKRPAATGHSRAVAALAAGAAQSLGLDAAEIRLVRRAGLVHDLGRMGVSNGIWEKPGPLSDSERERVRLYPYLTSRILGRVPALREVATVAGAHQERLDGTGYPHGLDAVSLRRPQRLLAAADVYVGLREDRHYRPAMSADDAARRLREEARAARLDADAVRAVLEAAGARVSRRGHWPDGITAREADVLRMVASGQPNATIAAALHITEKTVRNHVQHIYTKIGVSNRTGASLYALSHGILPAPLAE